MYNAVYLSWIKRKDLNSSFVTGTILPLLNDAFLALCLGFLGISCGKTAPEVFVDVTQKSGIDFKYTFGDDTYGNILESSGSGMTVFDYDNDGDQDLYLLNGTYLEGISDVEGKVFENTPNALYRNNGDGTFTEVAQQAGVDNRHWSMAAGSVDYDADGDLDLYLLNYGPNIFYQNIGDGTFRDVTVETGLRGPESLNGFTKWSVGVAFWDYDRDGAIDMMVGNFLAFDPSYRTPGQPNMMPHPGEYQGQPSFLYRQSATGRFEDVTAQLGLYYPDSKCMGLTVFDDDRDGDMDILQANDHQMNFLFRNNGATGFNETGIVSGIAVNDEGAPTGSMHPSIGDVDGDGWIDVLITDLEHGALYRNLGNGLYEDITARSGLAAAFAGKGAWAALLFDYDNDGDLDIFSANGAAEILDEQYPLLLNNNGLGQFTNAGMESGPYFQQKRSGRGAAAWDYDNDGDMDIIVSHVDLKATVALLRNESSNDNHWLGLSLLGRDGSIAWPGTYITIRTGEKRQVIVHQPGNSYLSFSDPRVHIGLGNHNQADKIEIEWPDGNKEVFENIKADQYLNIRQGSGKR
ncbi:MAG TPA: CRTAC1 family protein [Saprospiraceae bacterium]|nr:CRTAC1 family protein [Saprospiraceae bacterium]